MKSYAPIARHVLSSRHLYLSLKLLLFSALILSRLFFNAHVRVFTGGELTILNGVFMRSLRCITRKARFQKGGPFSFKIESLTYHLLLILVWKDWIRLCIQMWCAEFK